jgi:hypothetical protein
MKQALALGWVVLLACGGGETVKGGEPWQARADIPHAITAVDGQPTFFIQDERVVAEARAWGFIDYSYDTRGLLIGEHYDADTPAEVTISYDDRDQMILKERITTHEDGSVIGEYRTSYTYDADGRLATLTDEDLIDDVWTVRRVVSRTYEGGRLVAIRTDNPLDPNGEYFIETFLYEPAGHISDIDRVGYYGDGGIKMRQIRNLVWSIEGRVTSTRELDMVSDFFYTPEGDLLRIDETVTRVDHRNPAQPWDRTFGHDMSAPASFWFSPWKVDIAPESLINFFGRF